MSTYRLQPIMCIRENSNVIKSKSEIVNDFYNNEMNDCLTVLVEKLNATKILSNKFNLCRFNGAFVGTALP